MDNGIIVPPDGESCLNFKRADTICFMFLVPPHPLLLIHWHALVSSEGGQMAQIYRIELIEFSSGINLLVRLKANDKNVPGSLKNDH